MRGLLIRSEPLDAILRGEKTWELRTRRTHIRGIISLIRSGSGQVVGICELINCIGPLSLTDLRLNTDKHDIPESELRTWSNAEKILYAWVIKNARRFTRPVPYYHKSGIVTWHPLPESILKLK